VNTNEERAKFIGSANWQLVTTGPAVNLSSTKTLYRQAPQYWTKGTGPQPGLRGIDGNMVLPSHVEINFRECKPP